MAIAFAAAHTDETSTLYQWRSLVCVAWHTVPRARDLSVSFRAWDEVMRGIPGRVVFCALVAPNAGIPDGEAREEIQRAIKRQEGRFAGAVNVVSGAGFQAAAVRAILTGFTLAVRPPYPTAFVATPAEAASFIHQHWPKQDAPVPEAAELARALAAVAPR